MIDESTYKSTKQQPKLCKSDTKVYAYGANEKVLCLGNFRQLWKRQTKLRQRQFTLLRLEDLGFIEHVDGPTDWVSPIVVVPKPKSSLKKFVYALT